MLALLPESDELGDAPLVEPAPAILPVFDVSALLDGLGVPAVLDDAGGGAVDALVAGLVSLAEVLAAGANAMPGPPHQYEVIARVRTICLPPETALTR